jgi:hypothetical protein
MGTNNPKEARKEIEKAFEVVPADITKWKLGLGTGKEYYERSMKLRNSVNIRTENIHMSLEEVEHRSFLQFAHNL